MNKTKPGPKARPVQARLNERSIRIYGSGCREWIGQKDHKGYGQMKVAGKQVKTHRVSFELAKGPIPSGYVIMHSCDNRACLEPTHLSAGTVGDNARDMVAKGRHSSVRGTAPCWSCGADQKDPLVV